MNKGPKVMSTMRTLKKKMTKDATANPRRRKFLVKHSKVKSEIDPKQETRKWMASKNSRRLVSKKTIRTRSQKLLEKTESTFREIQSRYEAMKKRERKEQKEKNENRKALKR